MSSVDLPSSVLSVIGLLYMGFAFCYLTAACPPSCLCQHDGVEEVNCTGRGILGFPVDLHSNTRILFLGSNFISSINEDCLQELTDLSELHLERNIISTIPDFTFRSLETLEKLDLSYNNIAHISESSFSGLDNVVEVALQGNRITSISKGTFGELRSIEILNLNANNLKVIDPPVVPFGRPMNLKWLDIGSLGITSIPQYMFTQLGNLTFLNLSGNPGIQLNTPSLFSSLQQLDTLSLEGCEVRHVDPGVFGGLTNVVDLQLNSNAFAELPLDLFRNMVHLRRLQLNNNNLIHLPEKMFDSNDNLEYVQVSNNPWRCDCGLLGIRARWPTQPPIFLRHRGLICQSPKTLRGWDLWSVPLQQMYASCAKTIHHVSMVTVRVNINDHVRSINCPLPVTSRITWLTPNAEYISLQSNTSNSGSYNQMYSHTLLHNGTLVIDSVQPGTYVCFVTFDNGSYVMGRVDVEIAIMEEPTDRPGKDRNGQSNNHVLLAFPVIIILCILILAVWVTVRLRRSRLGSLLKKPSRCSFMNMRPRATSNPDIGDDFTYDYAYAHPRPLIDLTSEEDNAYAVGLLWEERRLLNGAASPAIRPVSRSVHERGPKYYNDCVRSVLPRSSHTFSGGEINGYITPSQRTAYPLSVISWKKKRIQEKNEHNFSAYQIPTIRPDSAVNRYLEVL